MINLQPIPARAAPTAPARPRAALTGDFPWAFAYDAASFYSQGTEAWLPQVYSPDHEINLYRDRIVGRVRDLVRNDGWAAGSIISALDNTIGGHYRLIANPDYRFLARLAGNPAFDEVWADEYRQAAEAEWRPYAEGADLYCDATRQQTFSQIAYLGLRHKLVDGEPLAQLEWVPDEVGYGAARYATRIRLIDPDRLSNPNEMVDTMHRRGGVEFNDGGTPIGYHIRRAHQFDWYGAVESMQWDYIPRETSFGRPVMLHDLDRDRVDQHRGLGMLVPILGRMKMLSKYDGAELGAAIIQAIFALSIESPYDQEGMKALLDGGDQSAAGELEYYAGLREGYRAGKPIAMDGARILPTFPGEQIKAVGATHPHNGYEPFQGAALRNVASATGQAAEQISKNWAGMSYSGARSAALDAGKTLKRRVLHYNQGFCNRIYMGWLEEAHEIADLPMPNGTSGSGRVPDFAEARAAYSRCRFLGAPKGWVDPVKEAQGATLRMDTAVSTLEQECAEQGGDWEEMLAQRAIEMRRMKELNLPRPAWIAGIPADQVDVKDRGE